MKMCHMQNVFDVLSLILAEYEHQVIMEMRFLSECSSFAGGHFSQVASQRASHEQLDSQAASQPAASQPARASSQQVASQQPAGQPASS